MGKAGWERERRGQGVAGTGANWELHALSKFYLIVAALACGNDQGQAFQIFQGKLKMCISA